MVGWSRCKSLGPSLEQYQKSEEGQACGSSDREPLADLERGPHGLTRMLDL